MPPTHTHRLPTSIPTSCFTSQGHFYPQPLPSLALVLHSLSDFKTHVAPPSLAPPPRGTPAAAVQGKLRSLQRLVYAAPAAASRSVWRHGSPPCSPLAPHCRPYLHAKHILLPAHSHTLGFLHFTNGSSARSFPFSQNSNFARPKQPSWPLPQTGSSPSVPTSLPDWLMVAPSALLFKSNLHSSLAQPMPSPRACPSPHSSASN